MANKLRGEFEVGFRGEVLKLRLGINQICELEEKRGDAVFELIEKIATAKSSMTDVRDLAWAMLRSAKPEATTDDAGELLDLIMNDPALFEQMQDSMIAAVAGEAEGKPKAQQKK